MLIEEASGWFKFVVESFNNLPKTWSRDFIQFQIQMEVIHGKMSYPLMSTSRKTLQEPNHDWISFDEPVSNSLFFYSMFSGGASNSYLGIAPKHRAVICGYWHAYCSGTK
jgi:hypothetical protein